MFFHLCQGVVIVHYLNYGFVYVNSKLSESKDNGTSFYVVEYFSWDLDTFVAQATVH